MSIEQKRVEPGVPAAGQWTAATKPAGPALAPAPAVIFDEAFEDARGRELAARLSRLGTRPARELTEAGRFADPLRQSYEEYALPAEDAGSAQQAFLAQLPSLSPERARHHLELVGFAVHNEMKHVGGSPVLSPSHDWELMIEPSDYSGETDLEERGTEDNYGRWSDAANTAVLLAMQEEAEAAAAERRHLAA